MRHTPENVAVWSDTFAKCSINMWCSMCNVKCKCSDLGAFTVAVAVCYVHCTGCSVLHANDEDLAVETGWVKLKCYLKK